MITSQSIAFKVAPVVLVSSRSYHLVDNDQGKVNV